MLYLLAKHVVVSSLAFLGSLFALLSLAVLLRICRRPILKLPTVTLVVLSIFAVISAGIADKTRSGTQFPSRQAPGNFIADLDIGELGEIPPASNLCISAILRGTNSTDILISLPYDRRPVGEKVDVYAATDLTLWDWIKPYSFDVSSVVSNILVSVTDDSVSTNGVLPMSFYSVGDAADSDCDGAPDSDERFLSRTDPSQPDTDADGFNDGWEIAHASLGYDPLAADTNGLLAASADLDGDGLTNYQEQILGTDVGNPDSDGDGISDGAEIPSASLLAATVQIGMQLAMSGQMPNPWYIIPALGSCSNPCVTNSSEFVPVAFYFGDPSTSHSEKYLLTLVPVSGSGYGAEPPSVSLLNGQYGVCDMALVFLRKSWHYEVRLAHSATNIPLPKGKDPDYALIGAAASPAAILYDPAELFGVSSVTDGVYTGDGKVAHIYVLGDPEVAPDYDRDGQITESEQERAKLGSPFRFWINDDNDSGDVSESAEDIPGSGSNGTDSTINGYSDVEDFTPLLLDISKVFPTDAPEFIRARVSWKLQSETVNAVWTALSATDAGMFQTEDCGAVFGSGLSQGVTNAAVVGLSGGVVLPAEFKVAMEQNDGQGVVLAEGCAAGANVYLIGLVDGAEALTGKVNMVVSSVEDMYRHLNVRGFSGESVTWQSQTNSPANRPDAETSARHLVFLHGANVSQSEARGWFAEVFKRMWQTGMTAKFTGVTWRSDIGSDMNYQENVSNAFFTASILAGQVAALPDTKVLMAHSLGNMVCSSMIQDYNLAPDCYLMCNSAVPAEAYTAIRAQVFPQLVHPEWEGYPSVSWVANWYDLFASDANDDRKYLGWPGRFSNVMQYAVNFYSTGDEVLELATDNDLDIFTGITSSLGRYAWHKQELLKGRNDFVGFGATDWSGWSIRLNNIGNTAITRAQAWQMCPQDFKTNTVFRCYPASMNSATIPLLVRDAHRALGIPALIPAAGAVSYGGGDTLERMINMNLQSVNGVSRPNGWPNHSSYGNRWLHSDLKNVAYYYTFKLYKRLVQEGALE